jgi:aminopeptidase-like protein
MKKDKIKVPDAGTEMVELVNHLYPICRSITGSGVRETLQVLKNHIPIELHEVPTGTRVFDWTIPKEWNIRDAWIKDAHGKKILDFKEHSLHILNYSIPVNQIVGLKELKEHLFTLPDQPDLIPYRTSYYKENWGFCMSHRQYEQLQDGEYHVVIDTTLEPGHLTWGEYFIKGERSDEILISCHICHPSLANDNLSGIVVAAKLAEFLGNRSSRYSFRFLFIPGTIGSITWLSMNEDKIPDIRHGLVLACVGDSAHVSWKKTRVQNSELDRAVTKIFQDSGDHYDVLPFSPYGYDERQFSSPGINLPFGCFMRSPWGTFPEYHTSADNPGFMNPESLNDSLHKILSVLELLNHNRTYLNLNPKCEPQLGRRGLYNQNGENPGMVVDQMAVLWILNQSDGQHSLLDIAEQANIPFTKISDAADALFHIGLLKEMG